eukprot:18448-Eustigmatos_ZCMA.PRE.1
MSALNATRNSPCRIGSTAKSTGPNTCTRTLKIRSMSTCTPLRPPPGMPGKARPWTFVGLEI